MNKLNICEMLKEILIYNTNIKNIDKLNILRL